MMFSPLPEKLWNRTLAAHLLSRAGFGGTPDQIEALVAMGPDKAVASLVSADEEGDLFPMPATLPPAERFAFKKREREAATDEERRQIRRELGQAEHLSMEDLRLWWLNRMRYTSDPLREKMTLFWHGHFATSIQKVNDAWLMRVQNETLRRNALGSLPVLLRDISRDPAMIRWLDLGQSRRDHPNENFAREVMELFSLGEGHYTEQDIQEAAKAFTGYRVRGETGEYYFSANDFDPSEKSFFGQTGPFTGDDIIDMIVARPQCARFLGRKLWIFFVSPEPTEEQISDLAALIQANRYEMRPTLTTLFRSAVFHSHRSLHHQIKGPVQWMIQTTRMLEIPLPEARVLEASLSSLGQVLFAPPNVKGWDGGRAWISASSLLYRYNLASYLLSGKARILGGGEGKAAVIPLDRIAPQGCRELTDSLLDTLAFRVFNTAPKPKERAAYLTFLEKKPRPYSDDVIRDLLQIMMGTPEFQLT